MAAISISVHLKCCFAATQGAMKGLATYYCNPVITRVAVSDTWWRPHHFRIWQLLTISMDKSKHIILIKMAVHVVRLEMSWCTLTFDLKKKMLDSCRQTNAGRSEKPGITMA